MGDKESTGGTLLFTAKTEKIREQPVSLLELVIILQSGQSHMVQTRFQLLLSISVHYLSVN